MRVGRPPIPAPRHDRRSIPAPAPSQRRADGPPPRSPAPSSRSGRRPRRCCAPPRDRARGNSPATARIARSPAVRAWHAVRSGNRTAPPARNRGRACTRIQASVMIPSTPSDPRNSRSGLGPAPDPGSRRVCTTPAGVTTRTLSTNSSIWVNRLAKCPPERVAIQPPSVENSKLCGKCRSVSPCGRNCASSAGPNTPPSIRAAREAASTSSTRSSCAQVDRDRAARGGRRRHPAHHAAAGAERDHLRAGARRPVQHRDQPCLVRRIRHHVRRVGVVAEQAAQRVGIALAESVRGAVVGARSSSIAARLAGGDRRGAARWIASSGGGVTSANSDTPKRAA